MQRGACLLYSRRPITGQSQDTCIAAQNAPVWTVLHFWPSDRAPVSPELKATE